MDFDNMDFSKVDFKNLSPEELEKFNEYLEGPNGDCTGDCSGCGADCSGQQVTPKISAYAAALVSGKGGTGRSVVTALLALALRRKGLTVGIIDADIAGPAIPHLLHVDGVMPNDGQRITPIIGQDGIKIVSMGLLGTESGEPCLLPSKETANIAAYFWVGAEWETPDCVLIDMPAGIGDIPLEMFTVLPIDQVILVTNPGELCAAAARKHLNLVKMLMLPVRGVIENMSSGDSLPLLGDGQLELLARLPYDADIAAAANSGTLAEISCEPIEKLAEAMAADIRAMK